MLGPFFTSSNPSFGKEDIRNKSSHRDRNTLDLFFFLFFFFDNAILPNSLGSIVVHFDGYSVEFLSIPSYGNCTRETLPCLSLLSFGYWELRSLRWTSISPIRLCVCLYWAGGRGAVPADALCFSRLLSCFFTSFIPLRHSRSNSLK